MPYIFIRLRNTRIAESSIFDGGRKVIYALGYRQVGHKITKFNSN